MPFGDTPFLGGEGMDVGRNLQTGTPVMTEEHDS